ncbi:ESAT-6-like protein EsxE [Austwickia sp. TVS 96-490-7B]|uniref:WXG100 family type VII secretion target n=1 Tax=Austwickia sp. TVS 96-490-7B TaxID=2830843 RepID=UPI001C562511|nr:WXG100 family type VII secretion target [Austwickia sp. TVS 96-490-7B]MBW3086637.1 ESAT-6-like protein EsxE [Austwickia sp. TVS 96-490-7B]
MFSVDLSRLDATVADLERAETAIEKELAELDAAVARLQHVWTGEAASAQAEAHQRWITSAATMRHGLLRMREAARTAHTNYSAGAAANVQMWESI